MESDVHSAAASPAEIEVLSMDEFAPVVTGSGVSLSLSLYI
jgi:hypothetical protein